MTHWRLRLLYLAACLAGPLQGAGVRDYLDKPAAWFQTEDAARVVKNVLSWQAASGGWPKNTDTTKPFTGDRAKLQATFDNSATTDELRLLSRMQGTAACSNAFLGGLDYILESQYTNGGWPQYAPPPANKYHRHITFNDHAMVRLLTFLREVSTEERYAFAGVARRRAARLAFERGVDCILKCQIRVNGRLTAWCAQHDEVDFAPRPARAYELVSLSGSESVGLTRLLMSIEQPSPEVIRAIEAAVAWFESARIPDIELVEVQDPSLPKGRERVVKISPGARPLWARFYEIETGRPFFCGRDGVKKYSLAEIEHERRVGYAWLGYWPESLLARDYPAWKARMARRN